MDITKNIRKHILHMTHYSHSSHVGACLSMVEILYTLYFEVMNVDPNHPNLEHRDKLLLSKGHGSAALYATLAEKGYFDASLLDCYYIDGGVLPGHLDKDSAPGIEISAGSLGHGLSLGVGMAIANRQSKNQGRIFVILGDGECNEGSIWEAVMLASHLCLNNLTAIIDANILQSLGRTHEVINQRNLRERWEAFHWNVHEVNGHNVNALKQALLAPQNGPKLVIANTVKGKGISFMENRLEWHYKSPNDEQYHKALAELEV